MAETQGMLLGQRQSPTTVDGDAVKGVAEISKQAEKGLALFSKSAAAELEADVEAATAFKATVDQQIAALQAEAEALAGKDNKKARTEKGKAAAALSNTDMYIDAVRVLKGLEPKHGHFIKGANHAPARTEEVENDAKAEEDVDVGDKDAKSAKKLEKKPRKEETAGISKAERDELDKLKNSIIELKKELKEAGLSGGAINKDERIVQMVTRMNELKEKECPGSSTSGKKDDKSDKKKKAALSGDMEAQVTKLQADIEIYRQKLASDFKYSKKEILADPDMVEMQEQLNRLLGTK